MAHVKQAAAVANNEARKSRMRRRLMNAAIEVIARKGLSGCQVRDIVRRARVSIGIFYFYFEDKHDIFLKILEENNDLLRQSLEQQVVEARQRNELGEILDLEQVLRMIYGGYFDFVDAHPKLFLCFFCSGAYMERGFGELVDRVMLEAAADTRRRLEIGIDTGFVRRDFDLDTLSHAISGMLVEVGHRYVLGKLKRREALETLVTFSLEGLRSRRGGSRE